MSRIKKQSGFIALVFVLSLSAVLTIVIFSITNKYTRVLSIKRELTVRDIFVLVLKNCKRRGIEKIASGSIPLGSVWFTGGTETGSRNYAPVYSAYFNSPKLQIRCSVDRVESKVENSVPVYFLFFRSETVEAGVSNQSDYISRISVSENSNNLVEEYTRLVFQ